MKKRSFAEGTSVTVRKSRDELEALLDRYGATHTAFLNEPGRALIAFRMADRNVRLSLALPDRADPVLRTVKAGFHIRERSASEIAAAWEKACREKWRALVLAVKAKLVSVEQGVETFEEAFMAHVVMPDGRTIGEHVAGPVALAYREGRSVPLLPGPVH